jgi:hypothetical protein
MGVAAGCAAAASAQTPEEEFCAPRQLVDYTAPLAHLPKVREPPRSGRLPFGPRRVRFAAISELGPYALGEMAVAGSEITYRLSLDGAGFGPKRIDWIVESRLVRLNARGRSLEVSKRRSDRVGLLRVASHGRPAPPRIIGFRRVDELGTYRYDILFRRPDGARLGGFHDYYRVVEGNPETRLALSGSSFRVGDELLEKIENPGTTWVFYGAGNDGFERLDNGAWESLDFESIFDRPNVVPAIGLSLGPGFAGGCDFLGFVVPPKMTPGRYRVSKSIGETGSLSAEFTIAP